MPKSPKSNQSASHSKCLNMGMESNKENQFHDNQKNYEDKSIFESDSISTNSDEQEESKPRASEHADEIERNTLKDEFSESSPRVLTSPDDPGTPDRPGRPSVPTPGKYGTKYGGAPSPGPAPCSAFLPPGFVPPTPPVSSGRPSFIRTGILRKKCLENSLKSEEICQEESQEEVKKMRLDDKPLLDKCL